MKMILIKSDSDLIMFYDTHNNRFPVENTLENSFTFYISIYGEWNLILLCSISSVQRDEVRICLGYCFIDSSNCFMQFSEIFRDYVSAPHQLIFIKYFSERKVQLSWQKLIIPRIVNKVSLQEKVRTFENNINSEIF